VTQYEVISESEVLDRGDRKAPRKKILIGAAVALALVAGAFEFGGFGGPAPAAVPGAPPVAVSVPLQRDIAQRLNFLGQFAATKQVEIRAQVGGSLTGVFFRDGDIVRQGQLLFQIDPVPYKIKYDQAEAELESANAKLSLSNREFVRAQQLKSTDAGSTENVDQRFADKAAAVAAVDGAKASLRDAQFDLSHTRVYAPFSGRIGTHLVSAGNLVAGSRAATSPTTLLTTIMSLSPIWINFDMSETDYMTFLRERAKAKGPLAEKVAVSLSDEARYDRQGTFDFVDNSLDRGSGTIHARATLDNSDALLTPGAFGRVQVAVSTPSQALLVPDAAILADQGDHNVYVLGKDNVAVSRKVKIGDLRGGLRVITSGLAPTDRVVIDGIPTVKAGSPVSPQAGQIRFASDQD
jgi:RND family efflux transporter MFP subunit